MSKDCCSTPRPPKHAPSPRYRRVVWTALGVNAVMFLVEVAGGLQAGSVSLLADSLDFLGDAANYGLSLAVLSLGLAWRARAAVVKGLSMGLFGVFVLARSGWTAVTGAAPDPLTMGTVALLALAANLAVAFLLYAYRDGDADMRSVWLCSRNDALGNLAVMAAALGVFGTGSAWPDLLVAAIMALLALSAAIEVLRQARGELRTMGLGYLR